MKLIVPPIKSQGIKTKLVPWIQALVPTTPTTKGRWIEPFLGTGVVAFNSGFRTALLCDVNPHIIGFYADIQAGAISPQLVRAYLEKEGEALRALGPDGYIHFNRIRDRFNRDHDPLDFLFLSRAGFNGMMRFNRKGEWNIPFCKKPARFSKAYITRIVNQVEDVAGVIQPSWEFRKARFEDTIAMAASDDLIYCDPPYWGRHTDYYGKWDETDEERLFEALSSTKARFILSTWHHNDYRENSMLKRYWHHFNMVTKDHFYHSGAKLHNRRAIVEALVFNFDSDVDAHSRNTSFDSFCYGIPTSARSSVG